MFKTLKRNLKLGLTALAILTAGGFAGTAFAQTYANDRVGYCANNPSSSLCPRQVDNCIAYPFGTSTYSYGSGGCARTFTAQELIVARVRYCGKSANRSKSVCRTTVARPNAANWAKQNPSALTTPTTNRNQFVKGTADGVDIGNFRVWNNYRETLNLNTATFNGRALGGDATDGVAFFASSSYTYYVGILSGTDLGAPVTQRSGTANWVGQFQAMWFETNRDFVLEVTFGGAGNKAGSIEAFVDRKGGQFYDAHNSTKYFYLKGDFDDSGLITGTVDVGDFINKDRDRPTGTTRYAGVLTGLIGQEGAVGVFHSHSNRYGGGFVARPAWGVTSATWLQSFTQELPSAPSTTNRRSQFLKGTTNGINSGDIVISTSSWGSKTLNLRTATFNGRALGGDASDGVAAIGGRVNGTGTWYWYSGIFSGTDLGAPVTETSGTANWGGSFQTTNYSIGTDFVLEVNFSNKSVAAFVQTRSSSVSHFYLNGNYDDSGLITGTVDLGNFTNNDRNRPTGSRRSGTLSGLIGQEGAVGAFISNYTGAIGYSGGFVARPANAGVTSATWLQSFTPGLPSVPSTTNRRNQFLKDLEDTSAGNIDNGDTVGDIVIRSYTGSLNLNTAEFNGRALGGDAADGVALFGGKANGQGTWYWYSGIFSGTDLGAPVTQRSGTASWVGRFKSIFRRIDRDFVLEVDFNGTGDKAGYVKAFVQESGTNHLYLDGSYDARGVITGTVDRGTFRNNNRDNPTGTLYRGILTGLIGQEGAVGAFISNAIGGNYGYSGGFVARPANAADNRYLNTTCTNDPFGPLCYLEKGKQRAKIIQCIQGSNASTTGCARAVELNSCINNPFTSNCVSDFAEHYVAARTNRINFCTNNPTNNFCRHMVGEICNYAPFASMCFHRTTYKPTRAGKIGFCHTNPTDLSCTGVRDNPNAVAWANSFTTALSSAPSTTNRRNQFLKGTASGLNSGDIVVYAGSWANKTLNLRTATFNSRALGGDASDGVNAIAGRVNNTGTWYWYAGIFSGTDLGAPVSETSGKASWVGRFQAINYGVDKDFVLEVDFSNKTVDAFVQRGGNQFFHIDGNYDSKGIITGRVNFRTFSNNDRSSPTGTNNAATLAGVIGTEGAVGAFISNQTGGGGYSGGFVARPANTADKTYLDRICTADPYHEFCYLTPLKNRFLPGTSTGLNRSKGTGRGDLTIRPERPLTVLTLGDSLKTGVSLGGSRNSGVAFFGNKTGSQYLYFAGLLSGTNLGGALSSRNVAMEWNGKIKAYNNTIDKDFKLKITFNGSSSHIGEVEAFVQRSGSQHYYIKGKFDSRGVITGTVDLGDFTGGDKGNPTADTTRYAGKLRGSIGELGAIGAFIANNSGDQGHYSGGFVASPNAVPRPPAIVYARYAYNRFIPTGSGPSVDRYSRGNAFIHTNYLRHLRDSTGDTLHLNSGATVNFLSPQINNLNLGVPFAGNRRTGDTRDGVFFFRGRACHYINGAYSSSPSSRTTCTSFSHPSSTRHFAGIIPSTNLGPVLDQTRGSAIWHGKIASILTTDGYFERNFQLNVNYGAKSISASVPFAYNYYPYTYNINGTYNANGVIRGTVTSVGGASAVLQGLIGRDGAVGAFVTTNATQANADYAGGFVAQSPAR